MEMAKDLSLPKGQAQRLYATSKYSDDDLNKILKNFLPKLNLEQSVWAEKVLRGCLERDPEKRIDSATLCEYIEKYRGFSL